MNWKIFYPLILMCAATVAVFAGSFFGGFHYDDAVTILENPHLDRWRTFVGHLDHMVRPVLYVTFFIDRSLYGANPAGYHVINLLLHLGSGVLIYRIVTRAMPEQNSALAFWTALLFLIHPIQTETVTYISGRASGLMAFWYLCALFLYIKTSEPGKHDRLYLSGAVASFLFAIGSKETAVTLPLVLLLWDVLIRRLSGPSLHGAILSRHLPFWLVLAAAAAWAWSHPRYNALAEFSFNIRPLWDHLLSQMHVTTYAIRLFFLPWNQSFDHDLPQFHSLTQWPIPLDLMILLGFAVAVAFSVRRLPPVAFGLSWFFIQLLPTSLIPRNDLLSERNLYLPSIGLLLALVALGSHLARWLITIIQRPALVRFCSSALATALIAALCLFTFQRNQLYQDRILLWSDAVRKSPNKARPHNNLGYAYSLKGDWERAIEEFRTAAQLDPDFILAQQNLRDAYLHRVGRP